MNESCPQYVCACVYACVSACVRMCVWRGIGNYDDISCACVYLCGGVGRGGGGGVSCVDESRAL